MAHEFYSTPAEIVVPLIRELYPVPPNLRQQVFDPGAGVGALGEVVLEELPRAVVSGIEIDKNIVVDAAHAYNGEVLTGDFLKMYPLFLKPHFVICNPPFSQWTEFVDRIFETCVGLTASDNATTVAVLGRLGMLASQGRHAWWVRQHPGLKLRVLSMRPSFTGDGHTDRYDYAWYVWGLPTGAPAIDWYKGGEFDEG